jgi:hypothetical protein
MRHSSLLRGSFQCVRGQFTLFNLNGRCCGNLQVSNESHRGDLLLLLLLLVVVVVTPFLLLSCSAAMYPSVSPTGCGAKSLSEPLSDSESLDSRGLAAGLGRDGLKLMLGDEALLADRKVRGLTWECSPLD